MEYEDLYLAGVEEVAQLRTRIDELESENEKSAELKEWYEGEIYRLELIHQRFKQQQKQIAKLNLILFHRENGLSHPDLQGEIDKSKFAELQKQIEGLKEGSKVKHPIDSEGNLNKRHSYCCKCGAGVKNQKYCHGCGKRLIWPEQALTKETE